MPRLVATRLGEQLTNGVIREGQRVNAAQVIRSGHAASDGGKANVVKAYYGLVLASKQQAMGPSALTGQGGEQAMLHRLLPWLGRCDNDAQLAFQVRITIAEDPGLTDVTLVSITSVRGVIRLKGRVPQDCDKRHIEAVICAALATAGLPYAGLINALHAR